MRLRRVKEWFRQVWGRRTVKVAVWGVAGLAIAMLGPLVAMAADAYNYGVVGEGAKKAMGLGSILLGSGVSAVPVYTWLENFILAKVTDSRWKVALTTAFSLLGWFIPGLAAGVDPKSLVMGALGTTGGAMLYHDLMARLGAFALPAQALVSFVSTAGALGPITKTQYDALVAKGSGLVAHYNPDGSPKPV